MTIEQEIEEMAEKLEKSQKPSLEETILKLGSENLKKAFPSLSDEQKALLVETIEEMRKAVSMKETVEKGRYDLEPEIETTINGEMAENLMKPKQDDQDEEIAEEAEARKQQEMRNQGGVPIEGWEGQIIKSELKKEEEDEEAKEEDEEKAEDKEDLEKKQGVPKGADLATHERCVQDVKKQGHDKSSAYAICNAAGAGMKKGEEETMEDKKAQAKEKLMTMMKRMQERKMEKSKCIAILAKNMEVSEEKVETVWDLMEKSYAEAEMPLDAKVSMAESDQAQVPAQMKKEMKGEKSESDVVVPKAKTDIEKDVKVPMSGESQELADEGEKPPVTMKKSDPVDDYFHVEEEVYSAPNDVFKSNTFGKNTHWTVDAFIEADAEDFKKRLTKSTFVDEGMSTEALKKSGETTTVNDLIEQNLDMTAGNVQTAMDNKSAKTSGGFLVKSFDETEMDALFADQDMWAEEKKSEK